jgi:mRNA interferase MazF
MGREQAGVRPALVVSDDAFNDVENGLYIVCPLTTKDRGLAYHIKVDPPDGRLTRTSFIMCEQVKSQSEQRFLQYRGTIPDNVLDEVQRMIVRFFTSRQTRPGT